jgi:hypothetical protein
VHKQWGVIGHWPALGGPCTMGKRQAGWPMYNGKSH